jgi:hypothetical protein
MSRIQADPDFEPRVAEWLEDDLEHAPEAVLETVLAAFPSIPQRRVMRLPWRFPTMNRFILVAAVVVLAALAGMGTIVVGSRTPDRPVPAPVPSASPSPSPMTFQAFAAARNAICVEAGASLNPLKPRFVGIFNDTLTEAQRTDWIAALEQYSIGNQSMIDRLAALPAPTELAAEQATDLGDLQAEEDQIRIVIDDLRSRHYPEAAAADAATNPMGARVLSWEAQHAFAHCP